MLNKLKITFCSPSSSFGTTLLLPAIQAFILIQLFLQLVEAGNDESNHKGKFYTFVLNNVVVKADEKKMLSSWAYEPSKLLFISVWQFCLH